MLLISFAPPCRLTGQIDWHAMQVSTARTGAPPVQPGESSGSALRCLSPAVCYVTQTAEEGTAPFSLFGVDISDLGAMAYSVEMCYFGASSAIMSKFRV
jgi:hypothetical protein